MKMIELQIIQRNDGFSKYHFELDTNQTMQWAFLKFFLVHLHIEH